MRKVLIVDDSATMRKILMRSLRQAEIKLEEILEASNGIEALAQIASNPEIELILSDINMPEMGGIDLVKNVRATKTADEPPDLDGDHGGRLRHGRLGNGERRQRVRHQTVHPRGAQGCNPTNQQLRAA